MLSNILKKYCKNIFNNFLIVESCRTHTHIFQKFPSPAPAPKSRNTLVLHSIKVNKAGYSNNTRRPVTKRLVFSYKIAGLVSPLWRCL